MNPAQGQMPQQGQAPTGQQPQAQPTQGQPGPAGQQRPPMYQPSQIRKLPMLSDDEKKRYEAGLAGLWTKVNNSPANSPEHMAARQKIIEFSRMLFGKIHQRRTQAQQGQQAQQQQQTQGQQAQPQAQQAQPRPASASAQSPTGQGPAKAPGQAQQPAQAQVQQPQQQQPQGQGQQSLQQQPKPVGGVAQGEGAATGAVAGINQASNPQAAAAQAAAAQRPKIPENLMRHVNGITFRPPAQLVGKSAAEIAKGIEELRDRYARMLWTMENTKNKVAKIDHAINTRAAQGNPLKEEELRQLQLQKETQMKMYGDAQKWIDGIRRQQGSAPASSQANQNGPAAGAQQVEAPQTANQTTPIPPPPAGPVNAQQQMASNRTLPANGTPTPAQVQAQAQARAIPNNAQQQANQLQGQNQGQMQGQPQASVQGQPQGQPQVQKPPPPQPPPPVNTAVAQAHSSATPAQAAAAAVAARVQTPQSATPVTAAGPTRALSHSAAMSLANQRANTTPGGAPIQNQQPSAGTPGTNGAVNQNLMGSGAQQQQGHPHAHPTQQPTIQSKMPIPKQLPEKATAVPQGVGVGAGVSSGRPTMSQGSGTLGGVMNQPSVNRIPAYSHDAEGDHVLSKKKLDELVRQVCGGSAEGTDENLLTPEVEESVLNMADSFVDNVLHAACRNSKERGSKVLEIRDIQLILERTYNIRVPGYSSDELRTVRKVQPSAGWIAKMSAVQAAKVMPGKGE